MILRIFGLSLWSRLPLFLMSFTLNVQHLFFEAGMGNDPGHEEEDVAVVVEFAKLLLVFSTDGAMRLFCGYSAATICHLPEYRKDEREGSYDECRYTLLALSGRIYKILF